MGNMLKKEICCKECLKSNVEPKYFTKNKIDIDEKILIGKIVEDIKYDKYENIINNIKIEKTQKLIEYTCSNNHTFVNKN